MKKRIAMGLGIAALALTAAACDAEYYGGYSAANGQYWRSKGICNSMAGYGAVVRANYCDYPVAGPSNSAVQTCMKLANAAFPSLGMDSVPAIYWLADLCGAGGGDAYYVF